MDDRAFLLHIRDATRRILQYTSNGREAFFEDAKTQDAVVRNLEIIGEAVKQLSEEFRRAHGDVPWKRVAGMRDRLIHAYFGVDLRLVWEAVEAAVPALLASVEDALLASGDSGSGDSR